VRVKKAGTVALVASSVEAIPKNSRRLDDIRASVSVRLGPRN
jgi:hypothetical protein